MTRQFVFWGSCVALLLMFACKSEHLKMPMGPACSYATTVVVIDGYRYLYIQYPDRPGTLVRLDEKPTSKTDPVLNYVCPCELGACSEMCAQAEKQVGHSTACQAAPNTVPHSPAAPAPTPATPTKPATPPNP